MKKLRNKTFTRNCKYLFERATIIVIPDDILVLPGKNILLVSLSTEEFLIQYENIITCCIISIVSH